MLKATDNLKPLCVSNMGWSISIYLIGSDIFETILQMGKAQKSPNCL